MDKTKSFQAFTLITVQRKNNEENKAEEKSDKEKSIEESKNTEKN